MAAGPSARRMRPGRVLAVVATIVVALAGAIGLLTLFTSRDTAPVSPGRTGGPGPEFRDLGARHLRPGDRPPVRFNSSPPTSGPHVPVAIRRDQAPISDDQLLHAIELGNVVLLYGTPDPPPGLRALAERTSDAPFNPELAQGGQAVILAYRRGTRGVVGVAWRHLLRSSSPDDPALRQFVEFWLGRGRSE